MLAENTNEKWRVIGDFNTYLYLSEKFRGVMPNWKAMTHFSDCVQKCKLMDMGFIRLTYTWEREVILRKGLTEVFAIYYGKLITQMPLLFISRPLIWP